MRDLINIVEGVKTHNRARLFMHVTSAKNVRSIMKKGLIPNVRGGNYDDVRWISLSGVYASNDAQHLAGYLQSHGIDDFAVVVVEVADGDSLPDEDLIDNNLRVIFDKACRSLRVDREDVLSGEIDFSDSLWSRVFSAFVKTLGRPRASDDEVRHIIQYWYDIDAGDGGDALMDWSDMKEAFVRACPNMVHVSTKTQYSVRVPNKIGFKGPTRIIAIVVDGKLTYNDVPKEAEDAVSELVSTLMDTHFPDRPITPEEKAKLFKLAQTRHPDRSKEEIEQAIDRLSPSAFKEMMAIYDKGNKQ